MKILTVRTVLPMLIAASQFSGLAQYKLALSFRGMCCSTNGAQVNCRPITESTLLTDATGGSTNGLAVVYHQQADTSFQSTSADTIEVVDASNGGSLNTLYGFYFGDSDWWNGIQLNRYAITNAAGTKVVRVDYIYTSQNGHSMGAAFVTKRFLHDGNGNTRAVIEGEMQWIVNPVTTNGTQVCKASFCTKKVRF